MRFKNKEAVSPVIGVILMVAITVILAAVVYIWVSGLTGGGVKDAPVISYTAASTSEGDFQIKITGVSVQQSVRAYKFFLKDNNGVTITTGTVDKIYGQDTITSHVYFQDNAVNGKVSTGDFFVVDKDYAEYGYKLVLIYTPTPGGATSLDATLT